MTIRSRSVEQTLLDKSTIKFYFLSFRRNKGGEEGRDHAGRQV